MNSFFVLIAFSIKSQVLIHQWLQIPNRNLPPLYPARALPTYCRHQPIIVRQTSFFFYVECVAQWRGKFLIYHISNCLTLDVLHERYDNLTRQILQSSFFNKKVYNKVIARIIRKMIILKILSTCKKKSLNAIFANSKVQVNCQHRLACLRHVLMYNVYNITWNYKEVI